MQIRVSWILILMLVIVELTLADRFKFPTGNAVADLAIWLAATATVFKLLEGVVRIQQRKWSNRVGIPYLPVVTYDQNAKERLANSWKELRRAVLLLLVVIAYGLGVNALQGVPNKELLINLLSILVAGAFLFFSKDDLIRLGREFLKWLNN